MLDFGKRLMKHQAIYSEEFVWRVVLRQFVGDVDLWVSAR